jgi:hypothetical protein
MATAASRVGMRRGSGGCDLVVLRFVVGVIESSCAGPSYAATAGAASRSRRGLLELATEARESRGARCVVQHGTKKMTRAYALIAAATIMTSVALGAATPAPASNHPLLGLWPIDEGSGQTVRDYSGGANRGVLGATNAADANDPSWIALPSTKDYKRSALHFGGDDYITVEDSATLEPTHISVGAVVRAPTSPGAYRYVVSKGALECQTASYGLYTGADGGLRFYVSNGADSILSADAGSQLWDGGWHIALGTFDGGVVRLFVDGHEIGTGTPTSLTLAYNFLTNDNFYIGDYRGSCANPLGFIGDIDAVAVANRAFDWSGT